jgi:hypothetical protein
MCRRCEIPYYELNGEEQKAFCGVTFISFPNAKLFVQMDENKRVNLTIQYCPFCGRKLSKE